MAIIIPDGGGTRVYTPHPEGSAPATCIDALDLGWKIGQFGEKYKVALVFYCGFDETIDDGSAIPLTVAKFFNASFNPKSSLSLFLAQWKGSDYKVPNNDIETLIGETALINVEQNDTGDRIYSNITSIMALPDAMADAAPGIPEGFVRLCDREDWEGPTPHSAMSEPAQAADKAAAAVAAKLPWETDLA